MHFAAWPFVVLLICVPVAALLYWVGRRRRRRKLLLLVPPASIGRLLTPYTGRLSWLKTTMVLAALFALGTAVMQPQWGQEPEDAPRFGRDIVFLLDVSLSMLAEDSDPNRLTNAKNAIAELVHAIGSDGGHRLGLVVFAGRAGLQCPLTLDYRFFLKRLADAGPESSSRSGSALEGALDQALTGFGKLDPAFTDFILLSDGEDHTGTPAAAVRRAVQYGVTVHTVGFGDPDTAAPIPDPDAASASADKLYLQQEDGQILTRMRQDTLLEMAQTGNGTYVAAGTEAADLSDLYGDEIVEKPTREIRAARSNRLAHRYAWFVWPAFLLLLLEPLLRYRRAKR